MNELGFLAVEALNNNDVDMMYDYVQQSLAEALDQQDEQAAYALVTFCQEHAFLDLCVQLLEQIDWQDADWQLLRAEVAVALDELDDATSYLLTITEDDALYPVALLQLADIYQLLGLYEVAQYKLETAKTIVPEEPLIDMALAELYMLSGDDYKARDILEALLHVDSEDVSEIEIKQKLGTTLLHLGEFEEAITYLEQLDNTQHTSDSLFELAIAYYQIAEYERAIKWFEYLLVRDPDYTSAELYLGAAHEQLGHYDKAIDALENALLNNPYQDSIYIALHRLYMLTQQMDKLDELFVDILANVPDITSLQVLYAYHLLHNEAYEEAVDFINEKLAEANEEYEFYWQLAKAYQQLEDDANAMAAYEQAYTFFGDDTRFLTDYASYLREIGQHNKMEAILTRIDQLDPDFVIEDWEGY